MVKEEMGMHHKMWGGKMLIVGLVVLANAYWAFMRWDYLVGLLLVLGGLLKLVGCCKKK